MAADYSKHLYKDYENLILENERLTARIRTLERYEKLYEALLKKREIEKQKNVALVGKVAELSKEIDRLKGLLNINGHNSGIPTSQTKIGQKKIIPNSRKKSQKHIGGQKGHAKHTLQPFAENEVTEIEIHMVEACPDCGGDLRETEEKIIKDELDYEVLVKKKRHIYPVCECCQCGKKVKELIPNRLKEDCQYGAHVQAEALAFMNIGNIPINKVKRIIYGLSEGEINLSNGYIAKLQERAERGLSLFSKDLTAKCREQQMLYWDDTVIEINGKHACLRFYGNENYALYKAHLRKNKEGLDEDTILSVLPKEAVVMHDHNKVNYNSEYSFMNVECNAHLIRDLQRITDNLQHSWSQKLIALISDTIKDREETLQKGKSEFEDAYVKEFFLKYNDIMLTAMQENKNDFNKYYGKDEQNLILRVLDYKDNYFGWVTCFQIPTTNNLSERALRGVKSKLKISGQFQNEKSARNYALIKSYIETCHRNGLNEMTALIRLCEENPYTLDEIIKGQSKG